MEENSPNQPLNSLESSEHIQTQSQNPIQNYKGNLAIILGVVIVLLVLVGSFYSFGISKKSPESMKVAPNTSPTIMPTDKPLTEMHADESLPQNFKPRQFNQQSKYFSTFSYPDELINTSDKLLTSLACSPVYSAKNKLDGYYTGLPSVTNPPGDQLKNDFILEEITKLKRSFSGISAVQYCLNQDDTYYLYTEASTPKASTSSTPEYSFAGYLTVLTKDKILDTFKLVETTPWYYSCSGLIQLTTNNIGYISCSGGDIARNANIYRVDINNRSIEQIYSCRDESDAQTGLSPVPPSCKLL